MNFIFEEKEIIEQAQPIVTSAHKKLGVSKKEALIEFGKTVFKSNALKEDEKEKKIRVIIPGNFQPFNNKHVDLYKQLCTMFEKDDIFIMPSDKRSFLNKPLSFYARKDLILKSKIGISPHNIKMRKSLGFDFIGLAKDLGVINHLNDYVLVVVVSSDDNGLFNIVDKETYYQPWPVELQDVPPNELIKLTKYLPSMIYHGFKYSSGLMASEMQSDFGKKIIEKKDLKKQILFQIGFTEIRKALKENDTDLLINALPYKITDLEKYAKDFLLPSEVDKLNEKEANIKKIIKNVEVEVVKNQEVLKDEQNIDNQDIEIA